MSADPGLPHWECLDCDEYFEQPIMGANANEICPNCDSHSIRFLNEDDIAEMFADKAADRQLETERQDF